NDVNSAASQVNAAKTALNGDNNLRVAKEHANNTIDGLAQLNNVQKAKLKEQVQSATTLDGVQTVKNSSQTLNTAMKGLRDSIANEATIKAGQNYTDASPNNRNEYDSAVTAAKAIINQTSNPTMEPNTITQATSQVTTKEHALNGAQNLAQAKTTAKNNLNNLTSINNAQKDALTRNIDGATTVAGVNQETAKATELNNAMHSLQNGINDETQTKQTQKYLDAEPSKKSAYDQAVNAAKAILTKASGQNVDKAAVEQALQNVNSTKTALNGDAKLNEAKAAAKQTLGTLTHINNAQRNALDNEITQATNVEGVNTVKAKAQQLDGAMGQLETSIRDKDTTLQSQNYQDADDAKRTAYSQAVNAAATILNKTAGGNTPKADVERAMQAVTQANTALNGIQNLERAKQAANTAITNASDLNTKQKEALKAQVTSAGRVSAANGVEHTATELNTAMTALKRAIADKADTKASGNYVNADANKRQAYDEKVTAAEHIVSGTPTPTLTPSDVTNAATQVTNAKTQLNGNHNLEVAKQNANTAIDGLTSLNGPQKAKLKEQVGQATTLPNVQTVRDNAQTLNTAMKGLRDSIANEATIKAGQNYTDASQNKQNDYNNAVTAAKAIIGQTTSPSMIAQEINQAKDQVTAKQQALNGQENLRTAQTNAKQHLNGLSDLTNAQKDAAKRQIEGATHVNEVTQAQNNADALNTAMTNLKNGIQDQNTIKQGVNFTDADEAKRNAYTNAVTQAEQILNKAQGPNTAKDGVETALQNVQRAKNELNGNQNVANAKTTAKNALNNLTSINNAQKAALKSQIEGATTVAGVNQVSTMASELNTAMSNLQRGINDEAATKAAQKYTEADRDKQTAYNDAVTAAKTLLDKTAGSNDNKVAVEQALQRVNTAKTALNGDARLNEAKNTAKQQLATMSHLTNAQKANLTEQIERGTTVAGVQGIQANAGTLNQAMNQLRQSIASKDATKSSEDYQDANADLQNAYNDAVTNAEGIISATNNPEMNPDTINQKASQVNSAKSALNGDEKLAAAKQTAKSDIGRLTDLNNAQRTAANAEVDQAPNLAAVTAAKNKATSLNTAMGNLKHALAEKDNTKRSVNYTDADQPKQQAYDTAVTQAEAITNANGSNANETQVQAALNQLNQAKNDLNGDNKVAQAKETAKRALASYSNLNNAQSTAATSQIDNATTVADVTAAQNTANELNTAMGQLQNGINDQNTVKQQVNFTDADQGKKDAYTNAVTNAQGILDKANGQNMTKAQVEAALNQVTTAKNALNGDANVRQAKSDAKANLGTLTHLNNAQKQDLTSQIEGATTVNGVNSVKTKAQDLDGAMQRLESAIANKDQTKASENYIDADPTKKTAFDNAITQAESYLNKDHGTNKDKQAVEQAIQSVTSTENALNGDANLQRAKTEATQAIDNLTQLNTPQKTALKQQVNAAQRVSGVTDLKNSATSLNNAMDQLKQAIGDHDTIVAGGNYTNASPDKQGAYTDAYNAAKNIVNGSPNVITNAADVTAATQRVNNAETSLNGDTNLATAKQQAKDALRQMTHLSDAQKQSITGQIDSATQVTGVQSVKDNATNLDNAMNQLRNSIANKDEVKASQPYVDADTDKQNAYNTAVTSAENIINATSQPTLDPSAVTQAANQVNTNKTALNGAQNLANKKQETTANINRLSHLNNAQKQDLNTQVTNAPNISTVNQVKTKAEQLDQAMERLINGIQDKDQVKQSVNFTDADPEKQTAYNNAVTAAENIINQANGTNANQSQVEAALSTVTTTKQALNGDRKVTDAKNNANQTLSTLDNLNNAQKGAVTGNINQAHTVAEVTQAIQTAQELNTAMGNLKNSLNDKDTTLGSQNFADADPEKKNAYNEAVRNAENILNKSTGTNVPKDQVEAAMNQVNTTKAALNGTQNLEKAKQHANTAIDGLSHLTNAQKEALKQLVQQSTTVAEAQGNEQKANNVDAAMDKLRQSIADNATTKQNQNYTDASPNKKDAYNNAVTTAQGIIDQTTNPSLDPTVINQAAGQVSTSKNALNGNENLEAAKQQATQSLGSLDNLNNAQKQAVTNQINGAHTVDEANQIKQNAQNLNTAMGNLKQAIADKDATKATVNFTDADQAKQQAYNTAVTNAENIISKANGGNATQTEVEQAIQQVNAAKQALNGNANVQHAKDEATALINNSNDLNQAQKDALKQQVQNATTVAGVNNVKQTAQELNNAMTQLKQGIADKEQTKADGNFVNADPDKQNAYKQAVAKAEALLNKQSGTNEVQAQVESITNEVNAAKQALNGNDNLANAKQQAKQQLANLTHLNDAQKQSFESQITQAPLVTDVTTINQKAQTLDHAMELLRNSVADNQTTLASEDYHDATAQRQNDYNKAVTAANNIINQTTSPTMNPDDVNGATTQVNNTKVALDGDENLAAAKQQANNRLDQLDHLNNAQKQQLQSQITQSSDIAAVNGHKQTAESLNTAMGNLINAIADHQAVEQRGNFINADTDKQTAYNTAVNEAAAMINKQTGQNANQTEVEQAITKVQTTLQALNGDHNLQVAKTNATQAIDALTSLNDPQKTALKDQVTAATLVTAVHQIEQNANTLNQAMHGLRQSIQDNAATKANSKYINEDQPEQQNYDQAVQAANNIINEQTATLDNNAINQVAATVNTTKAALHGDVKLQNDKDHAKQTVSQLAHLNNAQKHMEDTLIDSETTRTAVKQDLTEVQALDQLMDALQQSIADKDATRASSAYVNAEPNKKQAYDEAVQNAESIIAGLNNPTINKGNVSSATQAVISSKNALDGVERLAQDKQTAGNSLNHLDQLTPAQQQALENQINNATTRDKVAEIIAQAQALNEAMKALKESIKDQPQTEASSKFINEDQAQKDAYTQAVQHAKDLINKTTDPTLAKSIIDQATQAVTDAKNNLHGDQKLAQDKQRATETLNNLSNLNTPQRQALENQINNAATRGEVAQKLTEAQALNQAMEALRNSIQDQQQTESGSKFINEDKPQKDAYQAAVQNAKDLINQTGNPTLDKAQVEQLTHAFKQAKDNLHGDQKLADDKQHAVTDLNQLNGLNNPQRQALESQINNAATRGEVAQKLAEAKALDQAMQALRNSIQDQQQTEAGSKFINEDKPQKDAYQAAVQNAKDLINQTGNPTLDKSQVEQLTQAVTTAKDNLHGDQKLARDQQQAVTTVNALPNLNHAQQQTLTDAINAAPTRTEVAQHVQTATELDHAMETLKNKVDQVNTDKAQPNYTEASTDKKEAVDQALQAAQSITDPTNGSNAHKDAVEQALTKLQEKVNELNGNERVAEAKTQAKQTIDQLTHLNADQIATAKQNIDQATKLQPIAELVDQATQLNQSMDQLQQAVNEHANVEQTIDYTQADSDKQKAYKQAIADAENVLKQNANKQQVDQALQNILNAKQALNGDERVALAKTNGKHDIDQLNALNNAQQDGFKGRIDQSNDLNQIQQIVDEAKALNRAMDQLSQEITGNEGRTKGSTNYVNADTQVKQVYDEAVDKAKQALDKSSGQNLTAEQVIKLNDAVTAAKKALNGEERLNNRKAEALQRLDQLTHLNNAQRQLAIQQINNAETLNKASRAINRATKLDNAMGAVQQYIDEQHLGVISSTNYINADDNLKANYDNAIANAAHELDKVQGNAIAKAEAEQLKQNIIDAQNALNGDQNLANAKDKANAFVNSLNGLNQQQQDLAHKAINNADTVSDVTDIVNNQIDLNDAMETLKHLVDNEIPNAEQTVNYQNADDNAKTNFDDAKRLANTLLNSDNTNVNDINGAIQAVNDAIHNLNGDQRLQDAKDKAIQSINQALANKLKEIEASNATDQDKLIAKNKAEELANSIINNINKATSNQAVSQVQTAGNHAIEQVHANEIPKAKIDANKDVDKQVQALIDEIDRNPNLTDKEKQALKDRINQILQQGHNDINNALTKEEIEQAKAQLAQALQDIKGLVKAKEDAKQDVDKQVQALIDEIDQNPNLTDKEKQALKDRINQILQQGHNGINNAMTKEEIEQAKAQLAQALKEIKDLVKAKENAKQDVDKQVQALIDEIDQNPNLTDKEKQALKDRINQILQQGHNDINNAMTKEEIEQAKAQLAQALQDIKDLVKAKEDAKNAIKALANAKRDQINSNPDLTPEQKAKALKEIDEAEKRALQNVENAQTIDQLNRGLNLGLDDIRNTHVWEVDEQPAVNEIFEATPEQILVNGELIVHRDDIITEQDILAHINLIDQLSAEVIDTPSTATISDSLTAKVEVTLLDGSKVIVNVSVKVVEKELSVVKQQAIESIENAAQQKIDEINNSVTLTLEQKEAAIAEVNKLKQQAIDHVNNAPDVHSVEEIQQQEQAYIEQFNPEQFTIEQAKSNAIKSIEDAIQHMIDEIKARTDLTDKEKQEAIAKLNQLKEQAIQAIQRAQSISEITEQLEQFKAQMKAANPTAKELAKRKQEAISRIKDFSNEKINSIRNSEIGTADEKQAAMNQINEIVLETIRDINNAHTLQQVEAALNNGIARISAVQIVISDRAKQSSSTGNESNSHLTIGYGTANHPFNSSTIGHKKKLDEDDDIDPLHMRHFSNNFGNVIKNAIGVVGISGLLASFWFFIAKRRRKEDEEEELEIRDNNKDSIKETLDDTKHLPLLFAKRRRKEDEEDVEVTNENTDEKVLKDNEHSPLLFAKRRKDKEEDVETTTSIESKDEDVPLLLAKKKNQKDNQSKDKKSASKNTSKKVAAKKKKKKSKKNKK
ncbi:TPA: GA module-containing protein, partial [Staphylococcus aureus]|nr:GA module-containing protein [Staphylococcus aureus]HDZ5693168.1 GA module-containing protein [Staphylococcus aureus]HDZ5702950.1 GA module-containing protein [Staphylococcus aureus]